MTIKTKNPSKVTKTSSRFFRSAYSPPVRSTFTTTDSRTEQSHKEECDINQILSKYIKTGVLAHQRQYSPQYGEFTSTDFHEAQNIIATASSMFAELPAQVRNKFDNDPALFLDFAGDENNMQSMVDMGLATLKENLAKTNPVEPGSEAKPKPGSTKEDESPRDKTVVT